MRLPKGLSIIKHDGIILVQLYETLICKIDTNTGVLKLDSGGWKTKHTKKCINLVCQEYGIKVRQKNFEWLVDFQEINYKFTVPFRDGIELSYYKAA